MSRDAALELGPHAHLIVSRSGRLTFANLPARALFRISRDDLLRPFAELALARADRADRRHQQAMRDRRRVTVGEATFAPERGDPRRLDVSVTPLLSAETSRSARASRSRTSPATRRCRPSSRATGATSSWLKELQSTIDELETTNEELQSANEELQTTNEELQSTNEELETMNEELQSTNEELETINDELRERTGELNQVNDFLETILTSVGFGVAVLDPQQRVQVWNRRAEDLWGLRADEAVENHFLSLDIGLPSEQLAPALRAVLSGGSERESRELQPVNRRGRTIICAATVLPLVGPTPRDGARVRGVIVLRRTGRSTGRRIGRWITTTRRPPPARANGRRTPAGAAGTRGAGQRRRESPQAAQEDSARRQHEREERVHEAAAKRHAEAVDLQELHAQHEHEAAEREEAREERLRGRGAARPRRAGRRHAAGGAHAARPSARAGPRSPPCSYVEVLAVAARGRTRARPRATSAAPRHGADGCGSSYPNAPLLDSPLASGGGAGARPPPRAHRAWPRVHPSAARSRPRGARAARRAPARPGRSRPLGLRARTSSPISRCESTRGTAMPSRATRPQRSARCQKSASRRRSTRLSWEMACVTASRWARSERRSGSTITAPISGKRPSATVVRRSISPSRTIDSAFQRTSRPAAPADRSMCHGRTMSPGPSSSVLTVSPEHHLAREHALDDQQAHVQRIGLGQPPAVPLADRERRDADAQLVPARPRAARPSEAHRAPDRARAATARSRSRALGGWRSTTTRPRHLMPAWPSER